MLVNEEQDIGGAVVDLKTEQGQGRFTISVHENGYYQVSIPDYRGGEVVKAEAHDALAKLTLEWIEKFKELDHRIFHPSDARDFRDCSEETCREATRLVVQLRAALALVNKPDTNSANSIHPAHGQASKSEVQK